MKSAIMDPCPTPLPSSTEQITAAVRAELAAGRLDRASALCRQLLEATPDGAGALGLAGAVALRAGRHDLALALSDRAVALEPGSAGHHDTLGLALAAVGRLGESLEHHRRAVALSPADPEFQRDLGLILARMGRRREAGTVLAAVLARHPAFPGALSGLASVTLPGADYRSVLAWIHEALRPRTYVEIGVESGATLALARPPTLALGIDPAPRVSHTFGVPTRLFVSTSDDFFAGRDLIAELDGQRVDLAFIDGLHTFDQALKDFANLERSANASTVIVFHDILPLDAISSARVRRSDFWTGDTWKVLPALRRYRPDLAVFVVPTAPSGLAVVSGLDPSSTILVEAFDQIVAGLMPLTLADWQAQQRAFGPTTIPNRQAAVAEHLARLRGP